VVEVVNTNGEIDVAPGDGAQVEVTAERIAKAATDEAARDLLKDVRIEEQASPDRVRLETKTPPGMTRLGGSTEVRYHLKVPASATVRVRNTNGAVRVTGVTGAVRAETTNGGVRGIDLGGAVEATTTNGGVRLQVVSVADGGIRAETVNGGIDVTLPAAAKANVEANCVNGGISVSGLSIEGGESSRRRVDGRLNGGGPNVSLDTTNGGIRIRASEAR
jgi:DUF4097 and DUF4098 domain-containing protein YvlB